MSKGEEKWKVVRKSDTVLEVELPEGMVITSKDFNIKDLAEAIKKYEVISEGKVTSRGGTVTIKCCSGNTAIA